MTIHELPPVSEIVESITLPEGVIPIPDGDEGITLEHPRSGSLTVRATRSGEGLQGYAWIAQRRDELPAEPITVWDNGGGLSPAEQCKAMIQQWLSDAALS